MKLLLVIDGMHPRHGGPPAVVAGSAVALRQRGHEVKVLTTMLPGDEAVVNQTWASLTAAGVEMVFCAPAGLKALLAGPADGALIRRMVEWADVVHLHGIWNPILLIAGRVARAARRPYLVSVHGVLDFRALRRIRSKWLKKRAAIALFNIRGFLAHAAAVVFGSPSEAGQSWMPTRAMRTVFIPNGSWQVGTEAPDPLMLAKLAQVAPNLGRWAPSLLCYSRVHEEKGMARLVEAFDRVAGEFPDAGLLLAGLKQDAAYQAKVEQAIARSAERQRMVFTTELTGPKSQFLYGVCDIYVLPSIAEGFSMALTQALAHGKPMLITRFCHMPEVAEAGAGLVVEPTVDGLTQGLQQLLALPQAELAAMGRRARALFDDNFTWERVAVKLEAEYARAAGLSLPGAA